jgi:hypothetical protein
MITDLSLKQLTQLTKKPKPPKKQPIPLTDLLSLSNLRLVNMTFHFALPDNVEPKDFQHFLEARAHGMIIEALNQGFDASKETEITIGVIVDDDETAKTITTKH